MAIPVNIHARSHTSTSVHVHTYTRQARQLRPYYPLSYPVFNPLASGRTVEPSAYIASIVAACPPWIDWLSFDHAFSAGGAGLVPVFLSIEARWRACCQWLVAPAHQGSEAAPMGTLGLSIRSQMLDKNAFAALLKLLSWAPPELTQPAPAPHPVRYRCLLSRWFAVPKLLFFCRRLTFC